MKYYLFLFLLLILPFTNTQGQSTSLTDFINCVELQNGTDNLVLNGRPYQPTNVKADLHPYFQTEEWKPGVIYIAGNPYPADRLKYNLTTNELVIKHERPNGTTQKVVLSDLLVDSFYIDRHLFVNQNLVLPEKENSAYLEKIFADKLSFFRLQKKVFDAFYTKDRPYGRFSSQKDIYYLLLDGKTYKITKKKEFLACFPAHKTQLKKYIKDHALNWKKITKAQLSGLLKFCNEQL